ncbi:MAG: hypothetical protein J6K72_09585 [Clostridia bacterium]|nr:hypothetical protein [Clostridia bacterium]
MDGGFWRAYFGWGWGKNPVFWQIFFLNGGSSFLLCQKKRSKRKPVVELLGVWRALICPEGAGGWMVRFLVRWDL